MNKGLDQSDTISPIPNVIKRELRTPLALQPDPKIPKGLLKNFYEKILETSAEHTGPTSDCIPEESNEMEESPRNGEDLTTFQPSLENTDKLNRTPLSDHRQLFHC